MSRTYKDYNPQAVYRSIQKRAKLKGDPLDTRRLWLNEDPLDFGESLTGVVRGIQQGNFHPKEDWPFPSHY